MKFGRPRSIPVWPALWGWTVVWALIQVRGAGGTWRYFLQGEGLLFGQGPGSGLHLYAAHPELQIGPISFVAAWLIHFIGPMHGRVLAVLLMSCTGPLLLAALWRLAPTRRAPGRLLGAGLVFLPGWALLATHAGHLDDVLALSFGVAAMSTAARRHPVLTGLLLAAAADSKPWAAAFVALLLVFRGRSLVLGLASWAAGLAVAWLPFVLYDPHTLNAAHFTIEVARSSSLRLLGVMASATPSWDRPAQLLLGCGLAAVAVLRGRWAGVIALATAARVLLDPEVYGYYTSGVLLGAVAHDLIGTRHRWPVLTLAGTLTLYVPRLIPHLSLSAMGLLRLGYVVFAVAFVLLSRTVPDPDAEPLPRPAGPLVTDRSL